MAEAIARHALREGLLGDPADYFVASAGVHAPDGSPVTPETVAALERLGIACEGRSTPLSAQMVAGADHVFCMTESHMEVVQHLAGPEQSHKIDLLDPSGDVADPIGMGQDAYDSLAKTMMTLVPARLKEVYQS